MKKGPVREWFDALLFAVIAATLIRWATFEAFTIPTPSMEKSLLVGDFLFVNKLNYGPRTPKTPLQVGEEIIAPITGRMIAFDGMTPHKGFSFSRQTCPKRISLAYKLISK